MLDMDEPDATDDGNGADTVESDREDVKIPAARYRTMTYKKPREKMPVRVHFCALELCNDHTMGIGKHRIRKSVRRFVMPLASENATKLTHLLLLMS